MKTTKKPPEKILDWCMDLKVQTNQGECIFYAASGLVKKNNLFYVIADDELALGIFHPKDPSQNQMFTLLSGTLSEVHEERKKQKPDWESLTYIPKANGLLAVPSGSKPNRTLGVWIRMDSKKLHPPLEINFSELYIALQSRFSELNIEGATVQNQTLKLFQRGNGGLAQNAVIDLDLNGVIQDIQNTRSIHSRNILKTTPYHLGTLHGVQLGFTDACATPAGDLYVLCVAEDSASTYDDGLYRGALLGSIDDQGQLAILYELDCPFKPEGLWIEDHEDEKIIWAVTDADTRNQIASLYTAVIT